MSSFATRLRESRERIELSQTELAKLVDMVPSNVQHFESGRRTPSVRNLIKLADALGCSLDYLARRSERSGWDLAYHRGVADAIEAVEAATRSMRKPL